MAKSNVKLTADTSQAQQAMGALKTSWINAAAGMSVIENVLGKVGGALASVNQALRDQGQFFSAVKNEFELAAVQMAMAASDGMIKPMTLARGANVLMRGDLALTQEQMNTVAKAAIELGRATGNDVNQVFDTLSKAISTGAVKSLADYGIIINEGGSKSEKAAIALKRLEDRFGSLTIAVGDAAEAQDKLANEQHLNMMVAAKQFDSWSQKYTRWKGEMVEGLSLITDTIAGTSFSNFEQINRTMKGMLQVQEDTAKARVELEKSYRTWSLVAASDFSNRRERIEAEQKLIGIRAELLKVSKNAVDQEQKIISYAQQHNFELTDIFQRKKWIELVQGNINKLTKDVDADAAKWNLTVAVTQKTYENIYKFAKGIAGTIGAGMVWAETDEEEKARLERQKKAAEARRKADEAAYKASMDATREYLKAKEEESAKSLDADIEKLGRHFDAMRELEKRKRDEATTEQQLAEAQRINDAADRARELRKKQREWLREDVAKEDAIRKAALEKDLARRKEYVAKTKKLVEGLAQVSLAAIFAEKKARDGLSRTEYMMKQLAAYMKGEALKYAAKSIGYLAEGVAATFWNPPAAAAAFKASAISAAAATAFGGASVAAGKFAGSGTSGTSGGSGSGASAPSREAVGGASERPNLTIVVGERAVLLGTMDDLMRTINGGLESARRRGVL